VTLNALHHGHTKATELEGIDTLALIIILGLQMDMVEVDTANRPIVEVAMEAVGCTLGTITSHGVLPRHTSSMTL
jgi:hypothetical protein